MNPIGISLNHFEGFATDDLTGCSTDFWRKTTDARLKYTNVAPETCRTPYRVKSFRAERSVDWRFIVEVIAYRLSNTTFCMVILLCSTVHLVCQNENRRQNKYRFNWTRKVSTGILRRFPGEVNKARRLYSEWRDIGYGGEKKTRNPKRHSHIKSSCYITDVRLNLAFKLYFIRIFLTTLLLNCLMYGCIMLTVTFISQLRSSSSNL